LYWPVRNLPCQRAIHAPPLQVDDVLAQQPEKDGLRAAQEKQGGQRKREGARASACKL